MKSFNVPVHYRSLLVTSIKQKRREEDKIKKNYSPSKLQIGSLTVLLARHFGFCYGVENAIEIAFNTVSENIGKRIFMLSEMIHNQEVNADLKELGIKFLMDTKGKSILNFDDLNENDIVIIPAFGTTLEMEQLLKGKGINPKLYETTCPFVERVWNRAGKIGSDGYTVVIHGKPGHEETRATFSHSKAHTKTVIVKDMQEAQLLADYITKARSAENFYEDFKGQYSDNFDVNTDLQKIGIVNQTTMLASETQAIADYLKQTIVTFYSTLPNNQIDRFADTRDTLCYATNDNQNSVINMLEHKADIALVIGGYNSSNTSHLVELCERKLPTFFIKNENCFSGLDEISHFDMYKQTELITPNYISNKINPTIMITSGASCPDALTERVIGRFCEITGNKKYWDAMIQQQV